MKVAILGTRGVPAAYGGFETLAEELSVRLAARGHDVTVYARRGAVREEIGGRIRGVRVVFAPTVRHKYLDTVVHGRLVGPPRRRAKATTPSSSATAPTRSPAGCRASSAPARASS